MQKIGKKRMFCLEKYSFLELCLRLKVLSGKIAGAR
jgi:hypothetical protein